MLRRCCTLIIVCAMTSGFQQARNTSTDAGQRADVYTIYSLMMTNPKTSYGGDHNEIYLIGDTMVPGTPGEPCVRVPPAYAESFAEIMADYGRRKGNPATLERAFNITKPYQLLSADDVPKFFAQHSLRPTPYPNPKPLFQKATDLFRCKRPAETVWTKVM